MLANRKEQALSEGFQDILLSLGQMLHLVPPDHLLLVITSEGHKQYN